MSQISKLQKTIHAWAVRKEWRGPRAIQRPLVADLGLFVSEISEALEELRKNADPQYSYQTYTVEIEGVKFANMTRAQLGILLSADDDEHLDDLIEELDLVGKPEGVGPEFADLAIRLMETCEEYGLDLDFEIDRKMKYNEGRDLRHGGLLM